MDDLIKKVSLDRRLSLKAKGLYVVLATTQGNAYSVLDMSKDGKHSHYAAYEELLESGYIMRKRSERLFPENQEKSNDALFPENQEKFPENQEKPRARTRVKLVTIASNSKEKEKTYSPKDKEKSSGKFVKPKYQDVEDYMRSRKWKRPDAESIKFVDFYETKGWMIGKNHMKNWQAAVRTWERQGENVVQENRKMIGDDPMVVRLYTIDFKDVPDDKVINAAIFCIERNLKTPNSLAKRFFNNTSLNEKFERACADKSLPPSLPPTLK